VGINFETLKEGQEDLWETAGLLFLRGT